MTVNFAELDKVVLATETLPLGGFRMSAINCGTAGCMIGNYNALVGRREQTFQGISGTSNDYDTFRITELEYEWLFGASFPDGYQRSRNLRTSWYEMRGGIGAVTQEKALARLRKFISYKRRKHEAIHDAKYGVSVRSRTAEGNWNFVILAVQDVVAV